MSGDAATIGNRLATRVMRPDSVREAVLVAQANAAPFVAGGTALQLECANRGVWPSVLVVIDHLSELRALVSCDGELTLGAGCRLSDLERKTEVVRKAPLLAAAISHVGAPGVRALATLGGNLGYRGDLLPALLASDAEVSVLDAAGRTARYPLSGDIGLLFGIGLLVRVHFPCSVAPRVWRTYRKVGVRRTFNPPYVSVAVRIEHDEIALQSLRLVVGVNGAVVRLLDTEGTLVGCPVSALSRPALSALLTEELTRRVGGDVESESLAARALGGALQEFAA